MRNTPVCTAGEALPASVPLSRRSVFGGIAAVPALALTSLASAGPSSQQEIARRVSDLADEMSMLLGNLDGGAWQVRVAPAFQGKPVHDIQPAEVSAKLRLERGLLIARGALNELRPGDWRSGYNVPLGFATISNEDFRTPVRAADLPPRPSSC